MRICYLLLILLAFSFTGQAQERDDTCEPIDSLIVIDTLGNLTITWNMNDTALAYNYRYRELGETDWTTNATLDTFFVIDESDDCVEYEVSISTVCPFDTSSFTLDTVISFCPNATRPVLVDPDRLAVYPVPFSAQLTILSKDVSLEIKGITVRDLNGRLVWNQPYEATQEITTAVWPSGVYLVEIRTNEGRHVAKVLKL